MQKKRFIGLPLKSASGTPSDFKYLKNCYSGEMEMPQCFSAVRRRMYDEHELHIILSVLFLFSGPLPVLSSFQKNNCILVFSVSNVFFIVSLYHGSPCT